MQLNDLHTLIGIFTCVFENVSCPKHLLHYVSKDKKKHVFLCWPRKNWRQPKTAQRKLISCLSIWCNIFFSSLLSFYCDISLARCDLGTQPMGSLRRRKKEKKNTRIHNDKLNESKNSTEIKSKTYTHWYDTNWKFTFDQLFYTFFVTDYFIFFLSFRICFCCWNWRQFPDSFLYCLGWFYRMRTDDDEKTDTE